MKKVSWIVVITGAAVGLAAIVLTLLGNPANMGFCIACFLRDIAGACGLHSAAKVQYVRPEIIGLVLGAFIMSVATREFRAKAGSSPATRFVLGAFVMIGALAFLGCPLRMIIRLGGGDLNALVALVGFACGILCGVFFLNRGFSLKRAYPVGKAEGGVLPAIVAGLLILFLAVPALFKASTEGPGSMHAPVVAALLIALVVGALAQRARLCMAGGLRDVFLFRDFKLLYGFVAIFVVVLVGNLINGSVQAGLHAPAGGAQLACVELPRHGPGGLGLGAARRLPAQDQLILAGEGNGDSAVTVLGMMAGAAISHNFGLAGNADALNEAGEIVVGGISTAGKIAVILGFAVCLAVSLMNLPGKEEKA